MKLAIEVATGPLGEDAAEVGEEDQEEVAEAQVEEEAEEPVEATLTPDLSLGLMVGPLKSMHHIIFHQRYGM